MDTTDEELHPSKKRKISSIIQNGLLQPTKLINNVIPLNGNMYFSCPSKSDINKNHIVSITIDKTMKFTCDCKSYENI